MFIRAVDQGLERLLRTVLPLPEDVGDVSFDAPNGDWSAQLSRLTVNMFLYDVARSPHPAPTVTQRVNGSGQRERRAPQPMVQLSYLVSAWAGSARDEHQMLGDVVDRLVVLNQLPAEHLPAPSNSVVYLDLRADAENRTRDIWNAVGGRLKPAVTLQVAVATDAFGWTDEAPLVRQIEALSHPIPRKVT